MEDDDQKTGLVAGAAVLVGIAVGGVAMAVVKRTIGRSSDPIVAEAEAEVEPEEVVEAAEGEG